jgi:hypothetical protein
MEQARPAHHRDAPIICVAARNHACCREGQREAEDQVWSGRQPHISEPLQQQPAMYFCFSLLTLIPQHSRSDPQLTETVIAVWWGRVGIEALRTTETPVRCASRTVRAPVDSFSGRLCSDGAQRSWCLSTECSVCCSRSLSPLALRAHDAGTH